MNTDAALQQVCDLADQGRHAALGEILTVVSRMGDPAVMAMRDRLRTLSPRVPGPTTPPAANALMIAEIVTLLTDCDPAFVERVLTDLRMQLHPAKLRVVGDTS